MYFIICLGLTMGTSVHAGNNAQFFSNWGSKKVVANRNYVTKEIRVEDFHKLRLSGSMDVVYTQKTGKPKVEVYTSENIVDLLDINVKSNTLHISFKKGTRVSYNKLEIRVSSNELNEVSLTGSGDIYLRNGLQTNENATLGIAGSGDIKSGEISCKDLKLSIAGSGDIEVGRVKCDKLETKVAGSGDIEVKHVTATDVNALIAGSGDISLTGSALNAEYKISGSGDISTSDLKADHVEAYTTGGGEITCHAVKTLKVRSIGGGKVGYKGNPELDYQKKSIYKLKED